MAQGCIIRFFTQNDRGWKQLHSRIVRDDITLEEALAYAYHTVRASPATRERLLSVEIVDRAKLPSTEPTLEAVSP